MRITIYLLKMKCRGNTTTLDNALSEKSIKEKGFEAAKLKGLPFESRAYFNRGSASQPQWFSFVEDYVEGEILADVYNSSVSFLVLLKVTQPSERIFALNFGRAYHLLEGEKIEKRFGLRTVVNEVQSSKIKGIEVRKLAALAKQKSVWINQIADLRLFAEDMDFGDDLVRRIAGRTELDVYLEGADSLKVGLKREDTLADMGNLCECLLDAYRKDDYKEVFGFVDNVEQVKGAIIERLDECLLKEFQNPKSDIVIGLMCPDGVNHIVVRCPHCTSQELDPDFTAEEIGDILEGFQRELRSNNDATLNYADVKLSLVDESNQTLEVINLRELVGFEADFDDNRYILAEGDWYKVAASYLERINKSIEKSELSCQELQLIPADSNHTEGDYNQAVSNQRGDQFALFDKSLWRPRIADTRGSIEIMDLFSKSGQIICVKKFHRSSSLSHLFSQGGVAALALIEDSDARAYVQHLLQSLGEEWLSAGQIIQEDQLARGNITFVFAIMMRPSCQHAGGDKGLVLRLPFFSKLNYFLKKREIKRLGFDVKIAKIPMISV